MEIIQSINQNQINILNMIKEYVEINKEHFLSIANQNTILSEK